jgi:toxin ParE1/3/4
MKPHRVEFLKSAKLDIQHAYKWYNSQKENLGHEFLSELDDLQIQIKSNPKQFPKIRKVIRKAVLKRFPYSIYFIIQSNIIKIFAVFHNSRNPIIWKQRIK